nr:oligosaccharide flippase family protein [uncultured Sphaerochaeta sp.]
MNKTNTSLSKGILSYSISTWVNFFLGFLSTFILTRILAPEVLGSVNLYSSSVTSLLSIVCFGLDSSYLRFYHSPPQGDIKSYLRNSILFCSIVVVIFGGVVFSIDPLWFSEYFLGIKSSLLSVSIFVAVLDQVILRFLNFTYRMRMDSKKYNVQNILINVTLRFGVIGGVIVNKSAKTAIVSTTVLLTLLAIIYVFLQKNEFISKQTGCSFNLAGYKNVFKFGLFGAPANIVLHFYPLSSQILIKNIIGVGAVGVYSSASIFSAILSTVLGGFTTFWSAYIYAYHTTQKEKIINAHDSVIYFLIVIFAGMIGCRDIIYLLIGSEYQASKYFFSLILLYPILQIAGETTKYGIQLSNKTYIITIIAIVSLFSNIMIGYLMSIRIGLLGIAFGNSFAGLISFLLATIIGQHYYKSISNPRRLIFGCINLCAIAIFGVVIKDTVTTIISMIVCIIIGSIIYRKTVWELLAKISLFLEVRKRKHSKYRIK